MENQKALIEQAFGESSDSDGGEPLQHHRSFSGQVRSWERISEINGLWLCREFLSPDQQSSLLSAIQNEGWFTEASHNQAMRFGDLPEWANEISNSIRVVVHFSDFVSELTDFTACDVDKDTCSFPSNLLWREPLFDQIIVNVYQPGEGICPHVDLMRFEDGIAIVSLESPCVMHFSLAESEGCKTGGVKNSSPKTKIPVHLSPGSLVLMWGEARYLWMHEINRKPGFQIWENQEIHQRKRTSITLRKLSRTK